MKHFKKIFFSLLIILGLAAGIVVMTGRGSTLANNEDIKQTEQETSETDSQAPIFEEEMQQSMTKPVITKAVNLQKGIRLTWKAVENADGYRIERDGKFCKNITGKKGLSFLDKKARKNGKKYKYVIYAYCETDGKKIKSEPSKAWTQYYLQRIKIKEAVRDGNKNTTLTWGKNSKASGYESQYARKKSFNSARRIYARKSTAVSKVISGLSSKKNVYIRIRSYKKTKSGKQYSPWSSPVMLAAWNPKWKYAQNSKIHSGTAVLYYTDSPDKKGKTVCVNAGHGTLGGESKKTLSHPDGSPKVTGGTTASGAVYTMAVSSGTTVSGGKPEAEANLKVAVLLKKKLLKAGYNVLMIRQTPDVQLDNVARAVLANKYADCHIAVHFDSTTSDKGAFAINVPNISSYRNMEPVASHWREHNALADNIVRGMKEQGVKIYGKGFQGLDLTQTSYSTTPSIDIEVGDRKTSLTKKSLGNIADGIAAGIEKYFVSKK